MSLSNTLTQQEGRRHDEDYPFRLVVNVTKADAKGMLLNRLCCCMTVGHATLESASLAQVEFHEQARAILASNYGGVGNAILKRPDFTSYGMSCIIDEKHRTLHSCCHLGHPLDSGDSFLTF